MRKGLVSAIALIYLSFLSCSDAQMKRTVHMVGFTMKQGKDSLWREEAVYWKDSVMTNLPPDSTFSCTQAVGICVNGNDVHIVGFANDVRLPGPVAKYWKNGVATNIKTTGRATLRGIAVVGNDLYATGDAFVGHGYSFPQYWKNGEPFALNEKKRGNGYNITISGNDVYIVGAEQSAKQSVYGYYPQMVTYWKHGEQMKLITEDISASAYDIFVSGNDVYVTGRVQTARYSTAVYWKNGNAVTLTDGESDAGHARDFCFGERCICRGVGLSSG
jgi:hypothetical protein